MVLYTRFCKSASTASKSSGEVTPDSVKNPFAENKESKKIKQDKDLAKETKKQKIKERVDSLREQQQEQQLQQQEEEQGPREQQQQQLQDTSNAANQTTIEKNQGHE
jgi:hypothetical protein